MFSTHLAAPSRTPKATTLITPAKSRWLKVVSFGPGSESDPRTQEQLSKPKIGSLSFAGGGVKKVVRTMASARTAGVYEMAPVGAAGHGTTEVVDARDDAPTDASALEQGETEDSANVPSVFKRNQAKRR